MPSGHQTTCTTTGPAWLAYGIHTPNAPPRRGTSYKVTAWGVQCASASTLLRSLSPRIQPNQTATVAGAPAGFTCKSRADGAAKNRLFTVSCIRLEPAAMISWQAVGGSIS
jgi:hypothetical protein